MNDMNEKDMQHVIDTMARVAVRKAVGEVMERFATVWKRDYHASTGMIMSDYVSQCVERTIKEHQAHFITLGEMDEMLGTTAPIQTFHRNSPDEAWKAID